MRQKKLKIIFLKTSIKIVKSKMSTLSIPNDILLQLVHCLYQLDPKIALAICSLQKKDLKSKIRQDLVCRCLHRKKFNSTTQLLIAVTKNIWWFMDDDGPIDCANCFDILSPNYFVIAKNNEGKWVIVPKYYYFNFLNTGKLELLERKFGKLELLERKFGKQI